MSDDAAGAPQPSRSPRIGLALGGGSARGLAHIVVLEALDELGLKPAAIAGTSMGAICGALYAAGVRAADIRAGFVKELTGRGAFLRGLAGKLASGFPSLWSVRSPSVIDNVTLLEMMLPPVTPAVDPPLMTGKTGGGHGVVPAGLISPSPLPEKTDGAVSVSTGFARFNPYSPLPVKVPLLRNVQAESTSTPSPPLFVAVTKSRNTSPVACKLAPST